MTPDGGTDAQASTDGGVALDAQTNHDSGVVIADGGPLPDAFGGTDAGQPVDIIFSGSFGVVPAALWARVVDTSVGHATDWTMIPLTSGSFELTFPAAMPPSVFGVFIFYYLDDGDGVCTDGTDQAYMFFVSNTFSGDPIHADIGTASPSPDTVTCADATHDP